MSNFQFNSELFNQDHFVPEAVQDDIEFNEYSLMSYFWWTNLWIAVQWANLFDLNNIDIAQFVSEQIDGGSIEQKKYGNRALSLSLFIQASSYSDLIDRIEDLKKNTRWIEWDLDIRVNWQMRTYKATVSSLVFPRFSSLDDFLEWIEMQLIITSPHWMLKDPTINSSVLTWDNEKILLNIWTYEAYPRIIFSFKSTWNALTWIDISMKKAWETTSFVVSIAETITNDDVLILDYWTKIVTLNGNEINFSGFMTPMGDWHTVFWFEFTGTVNATQYIVYNPTFL